MKNELMDLYASCVDQKTTEQFRQACNRIAPIIIIDIILENEDLRSQLVEIIETHNAQAIRAEEYAGICAENALLRAQLAEMEKEIILRTAETRNEAKENIRLMEKLKEHDNNAEILRCAEEQAKLGSVVADKLAPYIIACGKTCDAVRARKEVKNDRT